MPRVPNFCMYPEQRRKDIHEASLRPCGPALARRDAIHTPSRPTIRTLRSVCVAALAALSLPACKDATLHAEKQPRPVRVETVKLQDYAPTVALTGEIRARVESDLSFRVTGRVTERLVDVGSRVKRDQELARLEPREEQADLDAANAAVKSAQAQLVQTTAAFDRQKTLLQRGFTTRATFDQTKAAQQTAEGSLASAKAQAETAEETLSYTVLRSPADGVITARTVEAGQVAQAAQPVFKLAEDGPRDAVFQVYESILSKKPGDSSVELTLVSDPRVKTTGKVREVAPTVDTKTGTVRVKIGVDKLPKGMTLGSAVTGVAHAEPRQAIIVPWSALTAEGDGPAVWLLDAASKTVNLQKIGIEAYRPGAIIVSSGLKPGDVVVVDGGKMLRPGQDVAIAEEAGQ